MPTTLVPYCAIAVLDDVHLSHLAGTLQIDWTGRQKADAVRSSPLCNVLLERHDLGQGRPPPKLLLVQVQKPDTAKQVSVYGLSLRPLLMSDH